MGSILFHRSGKRRVDELNRERGICLARNRLATVSKNINLFRKSFGLIFSVLTVSRGRKTQSVGPAQATVRNEWNPLREEVLQRFVRLS